MENAMLRARLLYSVFLSSKVPLVFSLGSASKTTILGWLGLIGGHVDTDRNVSVIGQMVNVL